MNRNIFDLDYPIIQAPMAGNILSADFIATVCNHGVLGFIASGYLSLEQLEERIINVWKSLTNPAAKFGVNLFLDDERKLAQTFAKPDYIKQIENEIGLIGEAAFLVHSTIAESDYVDLLIKYSVPIVSCTFGFLQASSVDKLKDNGIKIIGNATTLAEFEYCLNNGADAVVLQGTEAGGHQASFLSNEVNQLSTKDFLKQVREFDNDTIIIVAGGLSVLNYRDYLGNGADYVQLGSVFMMANESNVSAKCKQFISESINTKLTKDITGKWARGVENKLVALTQDRCELDFPIQHYATTKLRQHAKNLDLPEYLSLWASSNKDNHARHSLQELIELLTT